MGKQSNKRKSPKSQAGQEADPTKGEIKFHGVEKPSPSWSERLVKSLDAGAAIKEVRGARSDLTKKKIMVGLAALAALCGLVAAQWLRMGA